MPANDDGTYYRPGLVFLTRNPRNTGHQELATRDNTYVMVGGSREIDRPILVADFARGLDTVAATLTTDDGVPMRDLPVYGVEGYMQQTQAADSRGGAFDLDSAARDLEWTDAERETVARHLVRQCDDPTKNAIYLYEPAVPQPPWPTYPDTHHFKIAPLAAELGLVVEAFAYERATKARDSVLDGLAKQLEAQQVEAELTVG